MSLVPFAPFELLAPFDPFSMLTSAYDRPYGGALTFPQIQARDYSTPMVSRSKRIRWRSQGVGNLEEIFD